MPPVVGMPPMPPVVGEPPPLLGLVEVPPPVPPVSSPQAAPTRKHAEKRLAKITRSRFMARSVPHHVPLWVACV
jgi:hypothetical protein